MQRILAKEGYRVLLAQNGRDGLELAHGTRPSAIFLDVLMPGADGWQVLRMLKEDQELRACPVVLLTVSDEVQKGRSLGAVAHLVKPIDREALLGLLGRLLPKPAAEAEQSEEAEPVPHSGGSETMKRYA